MLADTVGFIHRLPHMLVEAFKATLEEVRTADLLLHVADASSPLAGEQIEVVDRVLEEIGAGSKPRIVVLNKADLLSNHSAALHSFETVTVSALRHEGLDRLLNAIARNFGKMREEVTVTLPAARGDLVAMARRDGEVLSEEYNDGVVAMRARVSAPVAGRLRKVVPERRLRTRSVRDGSSFDKARASALDRQNDQPWPSVQYTERPDALPDSFDSDFSRHCSARIAIAMRSICFVLRR